MKHITEWEKAHTHATALEIRRIRKDRGLTASELADQATQHGVTMTRTMISHLEAGRRQLLDMTEVIALAAALEVPLLQLLYPGEGDRIIAATAARVVSIDTAKREACACVLGNPEG